MQVVHELEPNCSEENSFWDQKIKKIDTCWLYLYWFFCIFISVSDGDVLKWNPTELLVLCIHVFLSIRIEEDISIFYSGVLDSFDMAREKSKQLLLIQHF